MLVYEDLDERFFVGVERSRSGEWIVIESGSKITSEVHLLRADDPKARRQSSVRASTGSSTRSVTGAINSSWSPTSTPRTSG